MNFIRAEPSNDEVKVIVGSEERRFTESKRRLTSHSDFFGAALSNPSWVESQTLEVRLPEEDPEIFGFIHTWMRTGDFGKLSVSEYLGVYATADKLFMRECKDAIVMEVMQYHADELIQQVSTGQIPLVELMYPSKLAQCFIDKFAFELATKPYRYHDESAFRKQHAPLFRQYDWAQDITIGTRIIVGAMALRNRFRRGTPRTLDPLFHIWDYLEDSFDW